MTAKLIQLRSMLGERGSVLIVRAAEAQQLLRLSITVITKETFDVFQTLLDRSMVGLQRGLMLAQLAMSLLQIREGAPEALASRESAMHVSQLRMGGLELLAVRICRIVADAFQVVHALLQCGMVRLQLRLLGRQATMTLAQI